MLESCRNAQERWGGVHLLIDRWLHERHALINAYHELHTDRDATARQALQRFCEYLVDYVSAGHFEIYEQLLAEAEAAAAGGGHTPGRPTDQSLGKPAGDDETHTQVQE